MSEVLTVLREFDLFGGDSSQYGIETPKINAQFVGVAPAMVFDVHVPTVLPAPSHLDRELRRRPLLRLRPPVGAGSPWIAGIDVVFNLQPPRRHRRIRCHRPTPGLLELAYDNAVRSSLDSCSSLLDPCL